MKHALLSLAAALLVASCSSSVDLTRMQTGDTANNIRLAANQQSGVKSRALQNIEALDEISVYPYECVVSGMRLFRARTITPQFLYQQGRWVRNTRGTKLPACYGVTLSVADLRLGGGGAVYYCDASSGAVLGRSDHGVANSWQSARIPYVPLSEPGADLP